MALSVALVMRKGRRIIEALRIEYKTELTHISLGDQTFEEFAEECLAKRQEAREAQSSLARLVEIRFSGGPIKIISIAQPLYDTFDV